MSPQPLVLLFLRRRFYLDSLVPALLPLVVHYPSGVNPRVVRLNTPISSSGPPSASPSSWPPYCPRLSSAFFGAHVLPTKASPSWHIPRWLCVVSQVLSSGNFFSLPLPLASSTMPTVAIAPCCRPSLSVGSFGHSEGLPAICTPGAATIFKITRIDIPCFSC